MILLFEPPETWSLMMLVTAIAIDNADLSNEAKEAIRRWRTDRGEGSPGLATLSDEVNKALNAHLDAQFFRRVKSRGNRAETVRR